MKRPSLPNLVTAVSVSLVSPEVIAENKADYEDCARLRTDGTCVTEVANVLPAIMLLLVHDETVKPPVSPPVPDLTDMTNPDGSLNGRALNIIRTFDQRCEAIDGIYARVSQSGEVFTSYGRQVREAIEFSGNGSINQSPEQTEKSALESSLQSLETAAGGCELAPMTLFTPGGQLTAAGQAEANRLAHQIHGLSSVRASLSSSIGTVITVTEQDPYKICSSGAAGGLRADRSNALEVLRVAIQAMNCQ